MDKNGFDAVRKWLTTDRSFQEIHNYFEAVLRIKLRLDSQYMSASQVMQILNVSRRQLFYWDKHGMKLSKKKTAKRAWRKFSIVDMLGFSILKRLLECGIKIAECKGILDLVRETVLNQHYFVGNFAHGEEIHLLIDVKDRTFDIRYGFEIRSQDPDLMLRLSKPTIIIPISPLLREIIVSIASESIRVEFAHDAFGGKNRSIFYIDGEKIDLKPLEEILQARSKIMNKSKSDEINTDEEK